MNGTTAPTSAHMPWHLSPHLPWRAIGDPLRQWADMPSFLVGEFVFFLLAAAALRHARATGNVVVWAAALVAGTSNDLFFMALPFVNNFWQAQAVVMLTPRLPLYIPCVYVCFMYYPTVAVRAAFCTTAPPRGSSPSEKRVVPRPALAALSGLLAMLFYWPYDVTGAKFLWWSWHDTDAPIAARVLGAPASSTLWTLTFVGAFAWLLDRQLQPPAPPAAHTTTTTTTDGNRSASPAGRAASVIRAAGGGGGAGAAARVLLPAALCSTPLMMAQMGVLQLPEPSGAPGHIALALGIAVYAAVAWRGVRSAAPVLSNKNGGRVSSSSPSAAASSSWSLVAAAALYAAALAAIWLCLDPATHRSTGVHQLPGTCGVAAVDIAGHTRHEFLCARDFDEDYDFRCVAGAGAGADGRGGGLPADGAEWYTICGRAHSFYAQGLGGVALAGAAVVSALCRLMIVP